MTDMDELERAGAADALDDEALAEVSGGSWLTDLLDRFRPFPAVDPRHPLP